MNQNPQLVRTDRAIITALVHLLKRKPFEKITVQDILDETPVTRATFYAHFRDKYEVAERMLKIFIQTRNEIHSSFLSSPTLSLDALTKNARFDKDFTDALMKIHTEKVDFRKTLAEEMEKEYVKTSKSPTREIEARIYAQAYLELYLSIMDSNTPSYSLEKTYQILVPVALKLLHISGDKDAEAFLLRRATRSKE